MNEALDPYAPGAELTVIDSQIMIFLTKLRGMGVPYTIIGNRIIIDVHDIPGVQRPLCPEKEDPCAQYAKRS